MEFHYIGFAESFAVDSKAILANLNVPVPESLVPANVTPQRPHRNDLPAATIRLAEELTCLDAALYEHAKDLCRQGLGQAAIRRWGLGHAAQFADCPVATSDRLASFVPSAAVSRQIAV